MKQFFDETLKPGNLAKKRYCWFWKRIYFNKTLININKNVMSSRTSHVETKRN